MPPRRKYRKPIKINSLIEETKMEILRGIYKDDSTIINKGADLLLGISYDRGKMKSEHLEYLRDEARRIAMEKTREADLIDSLLEGRIQAEKREKKTQTNFSKLVRALRKENHLEIEEGRVVISERLLNYCTSLSDQLGIHITSKMLIDEIERQEAEA